MKTLFSLKTRIGAVLTAATLTATAVPMTGLAATASTTPNLLKNGDFTSATATNPVTYGETKQVTVTAANHPDDWEITYNEAEYDSRTDGNNSNFGLMLAKKVLYFGGNAFSASQKVKGIEEGKRYSIEFGARTAGDNTALVTVKFLHYDEETDTYQTIKEYVDAQNEANGTNLKILTASVNQNNSADSEYTEASYGVRGGTNANNIPMTRNFNFIAPPYTNAVEVILGGDATSNASHPNQYIYIDNVTLRRSSEVVINGDFADLKNKTQCAGWTGGIAATDAVGTEGENNCYTIKNAGSSSCPQNVILKSGQKYKVTFKYKHTLGDNIADHSPFFNLSGRGDDYKQTSKIGFNPVLIGKDGDWDIYEGYITAPEGIVNEGYFLMGMLCRSRALKDGESWDEGYTMSYDDISIVEATTLSVNSTGGAKIEYSPAYDGDTVQLIVAKYEPGTTNLVDIDVETIGADAKAGYVTTYIASMAGKYDVKAFLWNGLDKMKPVTSSVTRASTVQELPYANTFSSADDAARVSYQDISTRDWAGTTDSNAYRTATVSIEDGKLVQRNVGGYWHLKNLPSRKCGNGQLTVDFKPQSTGILVVELDRSFVCEDELTGKNCYNFDGMFLVEDADGNRIAGFKADGRGASGNNPIVNGEFDGNARINNPNWQDNHSIKYEINFDTNKYKIYIDDTLMHLVTTDAEAEPVTEFSFTADSASKLVYNYSCNGEAVDNIRIFKKIEAAQTETSFSLDVGETASAVIEYTPSTESIFDMTYESGNTAIADVTANGLITARRAGTVQITAKSVRYGVELTWNVTVTDDRVVTPVTVPYEQTFDTENLEIKDLDGWSVVSRQPNTVLKTQDGKLVATGVTTINQNIGSAQAKLDFAKVESGKIRVDLEYKNVRGELTNVGGKDGVLNFYSEDGTKAACIMANGRGEFGVYDDTTLHKFNITRPWLNGVKLSVVFDLDREEPAYFVYRNDELVANTSDKSTDGSFWINSSALDISSMSFTFSNEGDYIDNVKIYVPEENA